jgi:pyruvate,orthophosphate dikinase
MSKAIYFFGAGQADGTGSQKELLGGKGAGLAEMTRLGIPVPPGFTITTEVCNSFFTAGGTLPDALKDEVRASLDRVASIVGTRFGNPEAPLLVSVRSGGRASMPGMMDTILNLGLNDVIVDGLAKATGNRKFALDAFRRFILLYSGVVLDVPRDKFEHALVAARQKAAKHLGLDPSRFTGAELERKVPDSKLDEEALTELIASEKAIVLKETGKPFPSDPTEQLWGAIAAVFKSWHNPRAKVYRACTTSPSRGAPRATCRRWCSATSETTPARASPSRAIRRPASDASTASGSPTRRARTSSPACARRIPSPRATATTRTASRRRMPDAYRELVAIYERLEKHFRDMQDIEFTIQSGKLYMLQCRNGKRTGRAAVRIAVEMVKEGLITEREAILRVDAFLDRPAPPPERSTPTRKEAPRARPPREPRRRERAHRVHADEAEKQAGQGKAVILVRAETSPEDIHGMKAARGILTARGGMTSHAAVVARGMGKSCVAGCSSIASATTCGRCTSASRRRTATRPRR